MGIDLSAVAVERGNQVIAELGLSNVSLSAADLTAWEPPTDGFDYAIAHGLYSWVPTSVRDGLLVHSSVCRASGQFGNLGDERVVLIAPVDDHFISRPSFRHRCPPPSGT